MIKLYSYCIPYDNGDAPNPFWGICTLNICKPKIRRYAEIGDWIVGTGSTSFGFQNKVVYAMEVTQIMTMQQYDDYCKMHLQQKIPNWQGRSYKERVGDCIYDFSYNPPAVRKGVHDQGNRPTDLGGKRTLLSDHFYYFGDKPEPLPPHLLPIVHQTQSHKSIANQPYVEAFIEWILTQKKAKNKLYSEPEGRRHFTLDGDYTTQCAKQHKLFDELEEEAGDV